MTDPGVDMAPDAVADAGRRLQTSAEQLAAKWTAARFALVGDDGLIGAGRLADAFRGRYVPASEAARSNADPLPDRIVDLSSAASISANEYSAAGQLSADLFRNVASGGE